MLHLAHSTESEPYLTFSLSLAALLAENGRYAEAAVYLGPGRSQPSEATVFMDRWKIVTQLQRGLRAQLGDEAFPAAGRRGAEQASVTAAGGFWAELEEMVGG